MQVSTQKLMQVPIDPSQKAALLFTYSGGRLLLLAAALGISLFGTIAQASEPTQTLHGAIQQANAHLSSRKSQLSLINASGHQVGVASSAWKPQLRLGGSATFADYNNSATRSRGFANGTESDGYQLELVLRQQLLDFQSSSRIRAAKSSHRQTEAELQELDRNIQLNVVRAYFDVLRFRALSATAQKNVVDGTKLYDIIDTQVQKGRSAKVDGHLATTQLASARAQLAEQQGLLRDAEVRYLRLTGEYPGALQPPAVPSLPADLATAVNTAVTKHPRYLAAKQAMQTAQQQYQAQKGANKPTLAVELFAENGHDPEAIQGRDQASGVRLVTAWNIYNGGGDFAASRAAAATAEAATHQADDVLQLITENVSRAWQALAASQAQLRYTQEQATADESVYSSYQKLLKAGRETPLNMFVVQRSRDRSRLVNLDLQYRVQLNQFEVALAIQALQ